MHFFVNSPFVRRARSVKKNVDRRELKSSLRELGQDNERLMYGKSYVVKTNSGFLTGLRSIAACVPSTVNNKQLRCYGIFFRSIKALRSAKRFKIASANRLINFNYLYLCFSLSLSLSLSFSLSLSSFLPGIQIVKTAHRIRSIGLDERKTRRPTSKMKISTN